MLTRCCAGALAEELAQGGAFRLVSGRAVLNMTEHLVVKTGTAVFFDGGGRKLKTGSFGFRVEANAKLCLYTTHLIDGSYDCGPGGGGAPSWGGRRRVGGRHACASWQP